MSFEPTMQEREENFITQLKEHTRRQDLPIEETQWDPPAHADAARRTVVSNHKGYIVSLQPTDLTAADSRSSPLPRPFPGINKRSLGASVRRRKKVGRPQTGGRQRIALSLPRAPHSLVALWLLSERTLASMPLHM
jgi:hypothetical protein